MGAGKGKSNRVSTSTGATVSAALLNWARWEEFASDSDTANVFLYEYYLGNYPRKATHVLNRKYTRAQEEEVVAELFADAASVGAVLLPSPYTPEDFEFKMIQDQIRQNQQVSVILKSKPKLKAYWSDVPFTLDKTSLMGMHRTRTFLQGIVKGINSLILEAGNKP